MDEMVKKWGRKSLYFMELFQHYILFGENFIGQVKVPLNSIYFNFNHEKTK